ncbi:MAG: hypothetical protein BSK19_14600 [Stenotrophomonas maltophilia]|nr:MAG: hypothetical protein BSK19_14600 [Stenotrophomonas maltophilia]
MALLGTIALAGKIMRNSVILIKQIRHDIDAGHDRWHSITNATVDVVTRSCRLHWRRFCRRCSQRGSR